MQINIFFDFGRSRELGKTVEVKLVYQDATYTSK